MKKIVLIILLTAFMLLPIHLWAFGKNKIIQRVPKWRIAESDHFQIYYYPEEAGIIPKVSQYLERAYRKVCADLDHYPKAKIPIILYLSPNEFIGNRIADVDEYTGGFTEAYKFRLVLPNQGSDKWFNHIITHEFTHVIEFDILLSGFWKSVRIFKLIFYPLWLMEGLAEYEGGEIDSTTREMYIRDAVLSGKLIPLRKLHNFAHLKPHQVVLGYKEGETAIRFIAEEYGPDKPALLIKNFRDRFDIQTVISETLGIDFAAFDKKWQEYLETRYERQQRRFPLNEPATYGRQITVNRTGFYDFNTNPVFSPDGKSIAYLTDHNGVNEIALLNRTGKKTKILAGRNSYFQTDFICREGQALSWSNQGSILAFAGKKSEKDYLFLYNLETEDLERLSFPLEKIYSPCFSPDGKKIVFVGMKEGITDLYLTDLSGNYQALTNNPNNDNYPSFSPDGRKIVYTSEVDEWNNLYLLKLPDLTVTQLTGLPRDEYAPTWTPDGKRILFISDQDGVNNIYVIDADGQQQKKLTNVIGAMFTPQVSPDGKELLFSSFRNGETYIFAGPLNLEESPAQAVDLPPAVSSPTVTSLPPVNLKTARPYKFSASTDLFFPVFAYSSADGAFVFAYWELSEMLGSHTLGLQTVYGSSYDSDTIDYQITYRYKRWRPQLIINTQGNTSTFTQTETNYRIRRKQFDEAAILAYPFDRFNRLELGAATSYVTEKNRTLENRRSYGRDNLGSVGWVRDTSSSKYIEPDSGSRTCLIWEKSLKTFQGTYAYQNYIFHNQQFINLRNENVFAYRFLAAFNQGRDRLTFNLPVRGYAWNENKGRNIVLGNVEYRFPLFTNLDYHMWYFVPDFYFKSIYASVFTDLGINWENYQQYRQLKTGNLKNSVGIGGRIHTFILQTFLLTISFDWAKPTTRSGNTIFYVRIGTIF
ncbi:MAG: hypothetical protein ABII74_10895 [Elusimicrobiota bacterium]